MSPLAQAPETLTRLSPRTLWLYACLCGICAALANPPVGWAVATVIGAVAFLWARPWAYGARRGFWLGWGFGLGYFTPTFHWIVEPFLVDPIRHGWMAPFAILLLSGGLALFWGAATAVAGWRRSGLVLVIAMAVAEFARGHVFTGFPWAMFVTTTVDHLFYQTAAWIGPYALTLVFWAVLWAAVVQWSRMRWLSAALVVAMIVLTTLPAPKAPAAAEDAPLLRAVQPNAAQDVKWDPAMIPVFLARKLDSTGAAPRADLILWPEISLPHSLGNAGPLLQVIADRADGAPVLVGAQRFLDGGLYNSLALVSEGGAVTDIYDKAHLVPFGEYMPLANRFAQLGIFGLATDGQFGFAAGTGGHLVDVPGLGLVQPILCYESVFPRNVGNTVERPRLLALSTNDAWFGQFGGPRQHLQQAQARAIEQGIPVLRSANTGISAVIDPRGHVLAELGLGLAGHVDHALPPVLPKTLYARWREAVFACLILCAAVAHLVVARRGRGSISD
ncbi:MAG: apolipoprotein N-acyltransferase [Pseudomonadota bacterium]